MSRSELVETAQQWLNLTGEGWVLLSHVGAAAWPVKLWPIYPHGGGVPPKLTEVGLMRAPHPLDVMRGLSAVNALQVDLARRRPAGCRTGPSS